MISNEPYPSDVSDAEYHAPSRFSCERHDQ